MDPRLQPRRPAPSFRPNLKLSAPYQYGRPASWLETVAFVVMMVFTALVPFALLILERWPR